MREDVIEIEVLEDGTIRTSTDQIGQANHSNAESFIAEMSRLLGGMTTEVKRRQAHTHSHSHSHAGH